ncbi:MAG: UDP-N-acetylglucosamine--N-acetylmuramyl-(pentapeptide) pyrophosphoryl-undecaprenol N-acetylglucosamine transferase [Opitutales bacterium]
MSKVLIACGGTGGHMAPGIAVAEVLQERKHSCLLLISEKQVDSRLVEKYSHLNFRTTPGRAFTGGLIKRLQFVTSLFSGFLLARKLIREESPDLVLLFGGFLSLGLGLAAHISGVPVAMHEANCVPGRSIRLLKRIASRIYLPDGVRLPAVPPGSIRYYGYPVRSEIKHVLKAEAARRLKIRVSHKLLVIIGGSQGAKVLNDWVLKNFEHLARKGISVYCVTGLGHSSSGTIHEVGYDGTDVTATLIPFSDQMGDVISAADLVISRAGAGSIAEIIHCRAPAILIPYPHAADNHQCANARMHEQHGAGMMLEQSRLDQLSKEVNELIFNDSLLATFKLNMERLDRFNSSERIASDIESLCVAYASVKAKAEAGVEVQS